MSMKNLPYMISQEFQLRPHNEELFDCQALIKTPFCPTTKEKDGLHLRIEGHQSLRLKWLAYSKNMPVDNISKPMGLQERRC